MGYNKKNILGYHKDLIEHPLSNNLIFQYAPHSNERPYSNIIILGTVSDSTYQHGVGGGGGREGWGKHINGVHLPSLLTYVKCHVTKPVVFI